jgi:hypothetical protein
LGNGESSHGRPFFLAILSIGTVGAVLLSVCLRDCTYLLIWLACIGVLIALCLVVGLVFTAVFMPIFWLLSRLVSRGAVDRKEHGCPDQD